MESLTNQQFSGVYSSLIISLQTILMNIIGMIYVPLVMMHYLCLLQDDPLRTGIISSVIFFVAMATCLQDFFGFNIGLMIIPSVSLIRNLASLFSSEGDDCANNVDQVKRSEEFSNRLAQMQTAVLIASVFYACVNLSGLLMYIYKKLSPSCMCAILVAHSLNLLIDCLSHIEVSLPIICVLSIGTVSYMLRNLKVTVPLIWPDGNCDLTSFKPFQILPMMLSLPIICLSFYLMQGDEANTYIGGGSANHLLHDAFSAYPSILTFPIFGVEWPIISYDVILIALISLLTHIAMTMSCFYALNRLSGKEISPRRIKNGFYIEALTSGLSSLFTFPMFVGFNPISVGLLSFTQLPSSWVSKGITIILLYVAFFVKTTYLITYIPYLYFFGWNLILISSTLGSGVHIGNLRNKNSAIRVAISVLFAMVLSKLRIETGSNQDIYKLTVESITSGSGLIAGFICWIIELFIIQRNKGKSQNDFVLPPCH